MCVCGGGLDQIVLLSQAACSDAVRAVLKAPWAAGHRLSYFVGSPLDTGDLERVRCGEASVVFVIADFNSPDTMREDKANLQAASALTAKFPQTQYRLMLVGMPALHTAHQIGLSGFNAFSMEALKAGMMATSTRCPGFSTLVVNAALPDLPDPACAFESGLQPNQPVSPWLVEYVQG